MKHHVLALTVIALVSMAAHAQGQQWSEHELAAAVDALVQPEADAGLLSGTLLIAQGDRVLIQRSYGFANWELQVPVSPSSRFAIASITKVMTAAVAETLAREGRLDLDAPVRRYIPGFPDGPKGGAPTVKQLLDHKAGVPHRVTAPIDETQRLLPADIVERVKKRGLLFEPGAEELYSSAGYTTLARVIELVEQKPFATILAEQVFRPAGMTGAIDETSQQLMSGRVMPYRFSVDGAQLVVASAAYKDMSFLTGAGSVYATAEDLLNFANAMRAGTLGKAAQEQVKAADGSWRGFYGRNNSEASVDVLPSSGITLVLLANLRSAATWQLRAQLKNLLQRKPTTAIQRPGPVGPRFEPTSSFVGKYGNPSDPVEISEVEGKLYRDEIEFYPTDGERYCSSASGFIFRFRRNASGSVDAMVTVNASGQETVLPRIAGLMPGPSRDHHRDDRGGRPLLGQPELVLLHDVDAEHVVAALQISGIERQAEGERVLRGFR
jgi:CubicO group peptidase (beta-lactamase class C family)